MFVLLIASTLAISVYQGRKFPGSADAFTVADSADASQKVTYNGGPIVPEVKVIPIFWGTFSQSERSTLENYYAQVTNSSYFGWLKEYSTPTQTFGYGSFVTSYSDLSIPTDSVTADTFRSKILDLIAQGLVPTNDENTYYPFHLGGWGRQIDYESSTPCVDFGALHDYSQKSDGEYVYYGLIPDCGNKFAWNAISHELIETVTDPLPDPGTVVVQGKNAWVTSDSSEVGDLCESSSAYVTGNDGKQYKVQKIYSNVVGGCTSGY